MHTNDQGNQLIIGHGSGNGSNIVVNQTTKPERPKPAIEAKWTKNTGLNSKRLGVVSVTTAGITLWQGYEMVRQEVATTDPFAWNHHVWGFAVACMMMMAGWMVLVGLVRVQRLQLFSPLLPGVFGARDGFLKLIKLQGNCIECERLGFSGVKLRFGNRVMESHDETMPNGSRKRIVDRKAPAAVCPRNSNHWFEIDPADTDRFE